MAPLAALLLAVLALEDPPSAADAAAAAFAKLDSGAQAAVINEIEQRVAQSTEPGLVKLIELRERARKELRVEPWKGPRFYSCAEFAPAQTERTLVPEGSDQAQQQLAEIAPERNAAPFCERVRYDFGANHAVDLGKDPEPVARLYDLLAGYPPGTDVIVAWLEAQLDWNDALDKKADYFDHCYCDRNGNAFGAITLFDAVSSQKAIEAPDADAIAYARLILKDNSFHSPIPADAKRQKLYKAQSDGFLEYFTHRTLIEAGAWLFVNEEAPLRADHEGLRNRVLLAMALDKDDPAKLRARFKTAKNRDGFVAAMDKLTDKNAKLWDSMAETKAARFATRTAIAEAAWVILEKRELAPPASQPSGG